MMADAIRILYVDDELGLLEIAKLYLEESGEFSVTTIDSVSAALDLLGKEKFDVIISDYQMPGKDGIQFLVEVRTSFGKIPFILFTGKGREEVVIQAINSGADFYLQKGGEPESQFAELSHKTHSAVSQKRADEALLKSTEELHAAYEELAATEMELRANLDKLTRQEQSLRESEEKFRSLAESSPDYIMRYDRQCRHMYLNPAALRISGLSEDKIIGKTHRETGFDETQSHFWEEKITGVFETGKPYQTQFAWDSVNGQVVLDWMLTPEFNDDGTVRSVLGVSRDVTHLKKVEEEVLEAQMRTAMILEGIADTFYSLDEAWRFTTVNPAAEKSPFGRPASELLGKIIWELYPGIVGTRIHQHYLDAAKNYTMEHYEAQSPLNGQWYEVFMQGRMSGVDVYMRDITERKRAEEELKSSEIRYRRFFEAVRDGILILDAETGTILDVNPFLIKLLGFTHEQFLGKKLWEIGIFRDIAASKENFKELQEKKQIQFENLPLETIDGRQIYSEFVSFVYDVDGKNVMQCNIRDITERKRAEVALLKNTEQLRIQKVELETQAEELRQSHLALEESRDKFRDLYEFAPIGYFTFNDKARITEVNLTGTTLLGIERSNLINHGLGRFIAPESHDAWDQYFVNIRQQEGKHTRSLNFIRVDGSLFPVWLEGVRLIDNDRVITVRIAFIDITERKVAEEALKESEGRLHSYIDKAPDGLFIADETGHYLEVNPAACRITGYEKEELLGMHIPDLLPPESHEAGAKHFHEVIEHGRGTGEILFRHKSGTIRYWSIDAVRLSSTRFMGFVKDITERKQTEDALSQANKKLNLLSGITRHDLMNKVITIQGFLRFARKAKDIHEIQPFLDKIQDSAKAIEHQIDFTKDYQDLGVKSPKWLNLSNMIVFASNPAIHIFDETGTLQIFADQLFEKVMYNLIDNTIRHGETATEVHVSVITDKDNIRIIWEDNGVGVLADQKEMIFTRGFGKNTGFGLFLIKEILAITGVTIQETGEPGKGARFEITVPNGKWRYGSEAS